MGPSNSAQGRAGAPEAGLSATLNQLGAACLPPCQGGFLLGEQHDIEHVAKRFDGRHPGGKDLR